MNTTAPDRATMNRKPVFTIPARGVINFDSGFVHKLLCDGPTFSTGSACAYSCDFCYVPSMNVKNWNDPENQAWQAIKAEAPEGRFENVVVRRAGALEAMVQQLTTRGKRRFDSLDDRRVIYSSPLVDVAANMDLVRETVEACALILALTNWHIRLLSKSNLLPKVAELLLDRRNIEHPLAPGHTFQGCEVYDRMIFGVSTGTLDDALAASFERGTPKVSKRIESLHRLQDDGFRTFGMICPSLPQRDYTKFAIQMAEAIRWQKCEHVWAEVLNVRGDSMVRTCAGLRAGGFEWEAGQLEKVAADKQAWEQYSRATFLAHAITMEQTGAPPKLRFLQYVTKATRPWWEEARKTGAVLL